MAYVLPDMAMSLDGFICGSNGEDFGLHDYFFAPAGAIATIIDEGFHITGAIIMGRGAYNMGAAQDGFADNPYQVPTFILTHHVPEKVAKAAETFLFVTHRMESALAQANAAAGEKAVVIGGGADIAQQCLKAGVVDKIQIHLVATLLGGGVRLFDHLDAEPVKLESTRVIQGAGVTHLLFNVAAVPKAKEDNGGKR